MARSRDHTTMLDADERTQRALELSFAYLNRRERTVSELRLQLERKGITEETADACVTTLLDDGYLDDGRFALMFVHDRRELASRGVADDLVETALARHEAEWRAGESELDRARALLRRRFPSPPRERRDRDRSLGVLIRRGFDSELALDALAAYAR